MTTRPRYGVRRIEDVEGGVIAWLYPGGADLDDILTQIARRQHDEEQVEWWAYRYVRTLGPDPRLPDDADYMSPAWTAYHAHMPPHVMLLDKEHPTALSIDGELDVGYYRRMPWCHCGEGHSWHFEPTGGPGRGASLAVVVSSW